MQYAPYPTRKRFTKGETSPLSPTRNLHAMVRLLYQVISTVNETGLNEKVWSQSSGNRRTVKPIKSKLAWKAK